MRADPVGQIAVQGGFGIGVVTGAQHSHEQIDRHDFTRLLVGEGDRVPGVVHEQLLAGTMLLAQNDILFVQPVAVELAIPTVAIPFGMNLAILLPEQLQGDVLVAGQFPMQRRKIQWR